MAISKLSANALALLVRSGQIEAAISRLQGMRSETGRLNGKPAGKRQPKTGAWIHCVAGDKVQVIYPDRAIDELTVTRVGPITLRLNKLGLEWSQRRSLLATEHIKRMQRQHKWVTTLKRNKKRA